ncbi:hypothetical protein HMI55_006221, partial [Coelomomyces lativittatus]
MVNPPSPSPSPSPSCPDPSSSSSSSSNHHPITLPWSRTTSTHPRIDQYLLSSVTSSVEKENTTVESHLAHIIQIEREPISHESEAKRKEEKLELECRTVVKQYSMFTRKEWLDIAILLEVTYDCPVSAVFIILAKGIEEIRPDSIQQRLQSELALAHEATNVSRALHKFLEQQLWTPECQHPFHPSYPTSLTLHAQNDPSGTTEASEAKSMENTIYSTFHPLSPTPSPRTSSKIASELIGDLATIRRFNEKFGSTLSSSHQNIDVKNNMEISQDEKDASLPPFTSTVYATKPFEKPSVSIDSPSTLSSRTSSPFFDPLSHSNQASPSFYQRDIQDDPWDSDSRKRGLTQTRSLIPSSFRKKAVDNAVDDPDANHDTHDDNEPDNNDDDDKKKKKKMMM